MDAYDSFIDKLNVFLCRFYLNKAFKGLLVLFCMLLVLLVAFSFSEYISFFSSSVRSFFFWCFVACAFLGFFLLCVYPFLQAIGCIKRMSYEKAARYLAARYPELDDKLYNIIDLHSIKGDSHISESLLDAAINQVSSSFVSYRFEKAVKWKSNRKYLYIFLLILCLVFVSWFVNPRILGSSERIIHYNQYYEPEFPFEIRIINPELKVLYEEDFLLRLYVEGDVLPSEIFLLIDGQNVVCRQVSANEFEYLFNRVQRDVSFQICTGRYISEEHLLEVDYKPLLSAMKVVLHYPPHTRLETKAIENTLNLDVPQGTRIDWELLFEHARSLHVCILNEYGEASQLGISESLIVDTVNRPLFSFSKTVLSSFEYVLLPDFAFFSQCVA